MAKKTMADRYASQRSSKVTRRRALPRLPDTDVIDRDDTTMNTSGVEGLYDVHEVHTTRNRRSGVGTTFTAEVATASATATTPSARPRTGAMPRRAANSARAGGAAGGAIARVNYSYVQRDLRRIAITAVAMLILLIVLNVILQAVIH